jgi:hypothetical protein
MRWLLLSWNSAAPAAGARIETDNPIKQQAFNTVFILTSPWPRFARRLETETGR